MALQSLQQLTGANYFFYYGATVFSTVGIVDPYVTQIILGAVNFFCTFGGLYVMEKFGRRRPLIVGGIWQSAWLFVFAAAGTAQPHGNSAIGKCKYAAVVLNRLLIVSDDCFRVHVHSRIRNDMGTGCMDSYRRDFPHTYSSEAGCIGDCQ